jgi:cation diffusion facilitator CzcD-associated flavoprotein CzcO
VTYRYPFPIFGRGGTALTTRWTPLPETYLSLAVDGFPNMFVMYGPGSGLNTNSIISMLENQALYITKCVAKMQRERLKAVEVKKEAVRDWMQYMQVRFFLHRILSYVADDKY